MNYEIKQERKYEMLESRMKKFVRPVSAGLAGLVLAYTVGCANVRPMVTSFDRGNGKVQIAAGVSIGADNRIDYIEDRQGNEYTLEEKTFWNSRTGTVIKYVLAIVAGYLIKEAFSKKGSSSDTTQSTPTTQQTPSSSGSSSSGGSHGSSGGSSSGSSGGSSGGSSDGSSGGSSGGYTPGGGETDN